MKLNVPKFDTSFLSGYPAHMQIVALGAGAGVFGVIANNGMEASSRTGEALMWVAIFAWVTSFFQFVCKAFGRNPVKVCGRLMMLGLFVALYIVTTVLWAVYDTFHTKPAHSRAILIFVLALITTLSYIVQLVLVSLAAKKEGCCDESCGEGDGVVENGKAEAKGASQKVSSSGLNVLLKEVTKPRPVVEQQAETST